MCDIYNESNQLSYNNNDINLKENHKDFKQSSEHSSLNTLAINSSQILSTYKKENSPLLSTNSFLNNSHSTLNSGENHYKNPSNSSNIQKMSDIYENEMDSSYITKQAFANVSGSIPNSAQSSENSLNTTTPTNKRSVDTLAKSINGSDSNKIFDLNDKHPSITLSCHSSNESASSIAKEENENKKGSSKNKKGKENNNEKGDKEDKDSRGTKKFGFKHFKNTISKTFSKASFRKFSISNKKTINSIDSTMDQQQQNLGFTSQEEQEEFNNFVNTLNTKKSKQRPSLNGLFLNPEFSSPHESSLPSTINEEPSPLLQPRKKSIENSNYELALSHLCEVFDYEEPMVLAKYLKAAKGDENLALKNYLKDSNNNKNSKTNKSNEDMKDISLQINEMKNIEGNTRKQAPVIIERKGRRVK
ncbi:hypothetical protein BCR36DRAFT_413611 [Piromyces finnis]|uniref:Uncharacterized protein n=1 Tax=Piromyces finnis TaxID=1754191 RepID=A0A1Y1V4I6_9FUNG|nr:hypothetical protein BCR36DRAFT_413611 [Piromyces finnis]|eukprot:ORX47258.1 hypothetical protein BCR36DRAFT_413611 [Piromyces finnis]